MALLSIYISLTITFGPSVTASLDVNPTFMVEAPTRLILSTDVHSVTLPHLIVVDPYVSEAYSELEAVLLIREEVRHAEQWSSLGPWFPVAYAATLGRPFEPYTTLAPEDYRILRDQDLSRMWAPSPELVQRCPLLRISDRKGFQILPCWTDW